MNTHRNITQPDDWWDAFRAAANKSHGGNLSAWLGDVAKASLPTTISRRLSERPPANRPKASEVESEDERQARLHSWDEQRDAIATAINANRNVSKRLSDSGGLPRSD